MSSNALTDKTPARWPAFREMALAALLALCPLTAGGAETLRVGGTGAGLAAAHLIGEQLRPLHPDIETEILPSLGTSGGIRALSEGVIQIAVALRALTPAERQAGLQEGGCVTTALTYVSSRPHPPGLTRAQLPSLYSSAAPNWPDGLPMRIILRSRDGTENFYLMKIIPGLESAFATAYRYSGIPVTASDQENADIAQRTEGSLALMTLLQLHAEKPKLAAVPLDGITGSRQTIADGSYPMPIRLCLVLPARPSSGATRFIAYVKSPPGQALLRSLGAEPAE